MRPEAQRRGQRPSDRTITGGPTPCPRARAWAGLLASGETKAPPLSGLVIAPPFIYHLHDFRASVSCSYRDLYTYDTSQRAQQGPGAASSPIAQNHKGQSALVHWCNYP